MGLFDHVRAGEALRIRAPAWNAMLDVAADHRAAPSLSAEPKARRSEGGIVPVKNTSGADRERFDILGVDAPIFTPADSLDAFKDQVALKGVTPTLGDHESRFVVLLEPVKAGGIGLAGVQGVFPVKVDVQDEDHEFADVDDGECGHL